MATLRGAGDTYNRPDIRRAAGVQCWYDWSPTPGGDGIPMIYNATQIGAALSGDGTWLLGFNEPDVPGQADMSPDAGAAAWHRLMESYPDRRLVSPSALELTWLARWYEIYRRIYGKPPRMDALGVHWYYEANGDPLVSFLAQVHRAVELARASEVPEVWLTEFALYPSWRFNSAAFLKAAYALLDTMPLVTRAFWYQAFWWNDGRESERRWAPPHDCYSGLALADGTLTEIGRAFAGQLPDWDHRADVNQDGVVDILDLTIVGANYGRRV